MQRLIERGLTVELIGEELSCVGPDEDARDVRQQLEQESFDVCGVCDRSGVIRFVECTDLKSGVVGDYSKPIPPEHKVDHLAPLWSALPRIVQVGRLFIKGPDDEEGIVTIADLNKQPARLLMFGCVSTLEMTMLELIRQHYDEDRWTAHLSPGRLDHAKKLQEERLKGGFELDLVGCLQFCDKARVCLKTIKICEGWCTGQSEGERLFKNLGRLRDHLAHGQDFVLDGDWKNIIANLQGARRLIQKSLDLLCTGAEGREVARGVLEACQ